MKWCENPALNWMKSCLFCFFHVTTWQADFKEKFKQFETRYLEMDSSGHSKRATYDPQCAMFFFYAYHWSWFQLFQFWLLCFIKSFRWTNGTKIYHVCREEAANLSAHVSSDIPSISQYTSNWPAKITNSGIQYLIINQLHNKLYI